MKRPDTRAFLFDVQRACELIAEFTTGMTLPEYAADLKTRSAVERQLEIIGEAIGQMLKLFPEVQEELPQAAQIIAFRNRLIHGYASVSNQVVWASSTATCPSSPPKSKSFWQHSRAGKTRSLRPCAQRRRLSRTAAHDAGYLPSKWMPGPARLVNSSSSASALRKRRPQ